jgi:hypothetical protein
MIKINTDFTEKIRENIPIHKIKLMKHEKISNLWSNFINNINYKKYFI